MLSLLTPQKELADHVSLGRGDSDRGTYRLGHIHRARLLAAMVHEVYERGYHAATVSGVVGRAHVSRRTFYQVFSGLEDCLIACFDDALERARPSVLAAYASQQRWADRIRAALGAILAFMDDEPELARLCVVEMLAAGPRALARRREVLDHLSTTLDEGRSRQYAAFALVPEATVGGVAAVIHARLLDQHDARLVEQSAPPLLALSGELMSVIVLPFLGPDDAREELGRRPVPPPLRHEPSLVTPSIAIPRMRLTVRTVRALSAIRAAPESSNRQIALHAGIADAAQASRLLARLHRLGLVQNGRHPRARGGPNAWRLTEDGSQLLESAMLAAGASEPPWGEEDWPHDVVPLE